MRAGVRSEVSRGCAGPLADSAGRWRLGRGSVTVFGHVLVLLDTQRGVLTDCEGQVGEKRLAGLRVIQIEHGHMMGGSERDRQRLLERGLCSPTTGSTSTRPARMTATRRSAIPRNALPRHHAEKLPRPWSRKRKDATDETKEGAESTLNPDRCNERKREQCEGRNRKRSGRCGSTSHTWPSARHETEAEAARMEGLNADGFGSTATALCGPTACGRVGIPNSIPSIQTDPQRPSLRKGIRMGGHRSRSGQPPRAPPPRLR